MFLCLLTGAQTLSEGSMEQASSVEELAATITDISNSAKTTAAAAEEAGRFVNQAGGQLGAQTLSLAVMDQKGLFGRGKRTKTLVGFLFIYLFLDFYLFCSVYKMPSMSFSFLYFKLDNAMSPISQYGGHHTSKNITQFQYLKINKTFHLLYLI